MAEVGLSGKTRRREGDPHGFTRFMRGALGQVWGGVSEEDAHNRDIGKAERGQRLARLIAGEPPEDIWQDLWAIFCERFDDTLERVMDGDASPEQLTAIRDLVAALDKKLVIGHSAMVRLASRRVASGLAARDHSEQSGGVSVSE